MGNYMLSVPESAIQTISLSTWKLELPRILWIHKYWKIKHIRNMHFLFFFPHLNKLSHSNALLGTASIYINMYVCMHVNIYVCRYVCMYVCVCLCVYIYIYIYIYIKKLHLYMSSHNSEKWGHGALESCIHFNMFIKRKSTKFAYSFF